MKINRIDPKGLGGGKLDERVQTYLDSIGGGYAPLDSMPVEALRAESSARNRAEMASHPPPAYAAVEQITLAGPAGTLPACVYTPPGYGPFPLLVYYHGGGWVFGAPDEYASANHILAVEAGCVVLAVDYRLAPEHRFPAALEDCYAAYLWGRAHADRLNTNPAWTALGGDSAGGNLAAAVSLLCRERGASMPARQILIYPAVDLTVGDWASMEAFSAYLLSKEGYSWVRQQYAPNPEDWRNPYLSPWHAADLSGLPSALVISAEFDILRDEGEAYARRLDEAGVPVVCSRYLGMPHGFALMAGIYDQAQIALDEIAAFLAKMKQVN